MICTVVTTVSCQCWSATDCDVKLPCELIDDAKSLVTSQFDIAFEGSLLHRSAGELHANAGLLHSNGSHVQFDVDLAKPEVTSFPDIATEVPFQYRPAGSCMWS